MHQEDNQKSHNREDYLADTLNKDQIKTNFNKANHNSKTNFSKANLNNKINFSKANLNSKINFNHRFSFKEIKVDYNQKVKDKKHQKIILVKQIELLLKYITLQVDLAK